MMNCRAGDAVSGMCGRPDEPATTGEITYLPQRRRPGLAAALMRMLSAPESVHQAIERVKKIKILKWSENFLLAAAFPSPA
jgi:hypothetical protein